MYIGKVNTRKENDTIINIRVSWTSLRFLFSTMDPLTEVPFASDGMPVVKQLVNIMDELQVGDFAKIFWDRFSPTERIELQKA